MRPIQPLASVNTPATVPVHTSTLRRASILGTALWLTTAVCLSPTPAMAQIIAPEIPAPAATTAPVAAISAEQGELDDLTALNRELEKRAQALKTQLMGDVCADPVAAQAVLSQSLPMAMGTPTPSASAMPGMEKLPPASTRQNPAATPSANPPANSEQLANVPPESLTGDTPLGNAKLVALMNQATVLVLAQDGSGSGFFITPNLIVTNHHVVAGAANGEVSIIGQGLDRPHMGRVIATTGDLGKLGPDYALVQIDNFSATTTLPLVTQSQALQSVIATGYPGLLMSADQNFRNLMAGDLSAMPTLVFSEGSIMAVQSGAGGVRVLAHSADISGGNSGGPLADKCGRVVGINTLVAVDPEQSRNAGYALASADLVRWLQSKGVAATVRDNPCEAS